jgi:hypothetical protein
MSFPIRRFRGSATSVVIAAIAAAVVLYGSIFFASADGYVAVSTQLRLWWIGASAVLAVATPHLLFPDHTFPQVLLRALRPGAILSREFKRGLPLLIVLALPGLALPIAAGLPMADVFMLAATAIPGIIAIWWMAVQTYLRLGAVSQLWQEGKRGDWFERSSLRDRMPVSMPRGSYPVLGATSGIFMTGAIFAIAWGALQSAGIPSAGLIVAFLAVTAAAVRQASWFSGSDAYVFRTQAFFSEMYRAFGGAKALYRDPLPIESLYWVPSSIRPAVWAQLRQMDRRMPLGRPIFAALLLFLVIVYAQGYGAAAAGVIAILVLAKNIAPAIVSRSDASPPGLHLRLHGPSRWILIRFAMSVRWTLPISIALAVAALFAASLPWTAVVGWLIIDLALALSLSVIFALSNEQAYRRRFA